jgi:hypothetical protein
MAGENMNILTELLVAEDQPAIKWLEDAAVSASNESEQAIQAKNALRIIKLLYDQIKLLDDITKLNDKIIEKQREHIKLKDDIIQNQRELIQLRDDTITILTKDAAA